MYRRTPDECEEQPCPDSHGWQEGYCLKAGGFRVLPGVREIGRTLEAAGVIPEHARTVGLVLRTLATWPTYDVLAAVLAIQFPNDTGGGVASKPLQSRTVNQIVNRLCAHSSCAVTRPTWQIPSNCDQL